MAKAGIDTVYNMTCKWLTLRVRMYSAMASSNSPTVWGCKTPAFIGPAVYTTKIHHKQYQQGFVSDIDQALRKSQKQNEQVYLRRLVAQPVPDFGG